MEPKVAGTLSSTAIAAKWGLSCVDSLSMRSVVVDEEGYYFQLDQ